VTRSRTATPATVSLDWQGAKKLAYGPHTLVVKAYNEAKNIATASARVTKVGGGKYKIAIKTTLQLTLGKVSHRTMSVRGSVAPTQKLASVAHTQVTFSRGRAGAGSPPRASPRAPSRRCTSPAASRSPACGG
jgi:hypothetical protein